MAMKYVDRAVYCADQAKYWRRIAENYPEKAEVAIEAAERNEKTSRFWFDKDERAKKARSRKHTNK